MNHVVPRRLRAAPVSALILSIGALSGCGPDATGAASASEAGVTAPPSVVATSEVEAGRYLAVVGGCNDCHTEGYMQVNGATPETEWLKGSVVGFRGPWGTTYPPNLRLSVTGMTEDQWVEMLRTRTGLPPMPWPNVNRMTEADARALYRYIASLGPSGSPAPASLVPGVEPGTPWIDFVPRNLPGAAGG